VGGRHGLHRGGSVGVDQGLTRLFYDGTCGLCRGAVRFAAKHDREGHLRFAPLGGSTFLRWIPVEQRAGLPDSLVVQTPEGEVLLRSAAVIHLLCRMGPGWRWVGVALRWIPLPLRDGAYRLVAWLRPTTRACPPHGPGQDARFEP